MKPAAINPYQPTVPIDDSQDVRDRLTFAGEINADDYLTMTSQRTFVLWVGKILLIAIATCFGLTVIAFVKFVIEHGTLPPRLLPHFISWYRYLRRPPAESPCQEGWISDQEFAYTDSLRGCRSPLAAFTVEFIESTHIRFETSRGSHLVVAREQVATEQGWQRILVYTSSKPSV